MKKDLQAIEKRLCSLLGVDDGRWATLKDLEYAISKIERRIDKDARVDFLVKDLTRFKSQVDRSLSNHIDTFKKNLEPSNTTAS